jgi:Peptidase A4 family
MAGSASAHRPIGVLIPTNPHATLPLGGGTVDSLNWSGYAVTSKSGGINRVTGSFTVPSAGLIPPGFAATWAGIGGYKTKDLIQAGAAEQSLPGNPLAGPQYYAWYELLPNSATQIHGCSGDPHCKVAPGDRISVKIHQASSMKWKISMVDAGHWRWSKTVKYHSSRSSAEWILEAPTVIAQTLLAPVGTVHFGPTSTYGMGGKTHTIASGNPTKVVLSLEGLVNEATPSALAANGQLFNDCAYAQTCKAP